MLDTSLTPDILKDLGWIVDKNQSRLVDNTMSAKPAQPCILNILFGSGMYWATIWLSFEDFECLSSLQLL